jgi:hypothetical protein
MNPTSNSLREQARSCRILAASVTTPGTRDALLNVAEEYDRRAERLESAAAGKERA